MAEFRVCRTCAESKPEPDFYRQKNGTLFHDCKPCWRAKVKANRAAKIDYYREFDRGRNDDPDRVAMRAAYRKTLSNAYKAENSRRYRERYPERVPTNVAVGNALRDGKISKPDACERCRVVGPVTAHHEDYSKPFEIDWLCRICHGARHREINAERRAAQQRGSEP